MEEWVLFLSIIWHEVIQPHKRKIKIVNNILDLTLLEFFFFTKISFMKNKKIKNLSIIILAQILIMNIFPAEAQTVNSTSVKVGGLDALLQASFIVQIVILILISLSILCWGIAYGKYSEFKSLKTENQKFNEFFWKASSLDDVFDKIEKFKNSSHARLFKAAYAEMKKTSDLKFFF